MSPIDDELRTALSSRTDHVELSPDFFTGVEHRARGMRRRKIAATVAGSALAVSALGLGGPVVASLLDTSSSTSPRDYATAPALQAEPYTLDPTAPWEYRGDPLDQGTIDTTAREWGTARGLAEDDVRFAPLYGETRTSQTLLFFVAQGPEGPARWGVAVSTGSGPEFLVDEPVGSRTSALPLALGTDADARLVVVAAPETTLRYATETATEWRDMESLAPGGGATDLDGIPTEDQIAVLGPDGTPVTMLDAPSPVGSVEREDEGPGTETPLDVDVAPYALDLDAPWSYRGPGELTQHPDLASEDQRRFEQGGQGRSGDAWSQTPLLGVELDGLSVLITLHRSGDEAYVTTTWQRQDEAPRHAEQPVRDGALVVQSFLPQSDGTGVLVALGAPRAGAVETDVQVLEQLHNEDGYGVWTAPEEVPAGELFLYGQGDGLLYHSEPLRRS